MKYSVVVPLYNKEHYIEKTLKSVLNQTYQDYEILVVDDGSSDKSVENAKKVCSDKIKIIMQNNQGVSAARNTGIHHAKGSYIAFLDADDEWCENYLETIDSLTEKYTESDIYVTAYAINMGNGKVNYSTQLNPESGCLNSYWLTLAKGYDFVWTSATVIRRDALLNAGGFKVGEKIGQDLDMWARVAANNPKVAYSAKICVNYNRAAESNARTRVKIAKAGAFMWDLENELQNPKRTRKEIVAIQQKYDKKMTAYIFTSIIADDKTQVKKLLKKWKGTKNLRNITLRVGLYVAMFMPTIVNKWIYKVRLKVF